MSNIVYIAASLDGFIADKDGGLEWLQNTPNPDGIDFGYKDFIDRIDAIIMGRRTFEVVLGFGIEWPYKKPVFVLTNTLKVVSDILKEHVEIITGNLQDIVNNLNKRGLKNIYIDGGSTIQSFLKENLIQEIIITTIPIILGGGVPLFSELQNSVSLELIKSEVFKDSIVQNHYRIKI